MITSGPSCWVGRKVRLRAVEPADHRTLAAFDRDSAAQTGGYRHRAAHRADDDLQDLQLAIETLRGRMLVGSLSVTHAGSQLDRFSYGIGIGPRHRGCGYAADAIAVLLGFMFGRCGYRKCEVSVHGGNFASLALHGSLGFREEARRRDTELRRGDITYPVTMGITAREFTVLHADFPDVFSRRGRHWRGRGRHWSTRHVG
jgi:RimJ/RimL family protein N-acetyltransferase